VKQLSWTKKIK